MALLIFYTLDVPIMWHSMVARSISLHTSGDRKLFYWILFVSPIFKAASPNMLMHLFYELYLGSYYKNSWYRYVVNSIVSSSELYSDNSHSSPRHYHHPAYFCNFSELLLSEVVFYYSLVYFFQAASTTSASIRTETFSVLFTPSPIPTAPNS